MNSSECSDANGRPISTVRLNDSRWPISSGASASHPSASGRGFSAEQRRCSRPPGGTHALWSRVLPPPRRLAEETSTGLSTYQADARTRTGDPFITSEVLYQLSYVGQGRRPYYSGPKTPE